MQESGCVMNQHHDSKPAPVAVTTPSQQAGEATPPREPWWWVERCVWTEGMLTRLTSGESADRVWFRLWDKTYAPANLQSAFQKVWRSGGSAGADAQTVAHFGRRAEAELQRLHEQLRDGTYRPQPVRRAWIPKPGRQAGPAPNALRRVNTLLKAGHDWVVDADLKSYFDTIPHDRLLALVTERVADGRVRTKTPRLDGRSLSAIVTDVNRSLRGWYQYFQHSKANTFTAVDGYVRRRLRSVLPWREDGVGKGIGATHQRWPNKWFARSGLLSLAAEHEWTRAIVAI